jgi:hypothetical protein
VRLTREPRADAAPEAAAAEALVVEEVRFLLPLARAGCGLRFRDAYRGASAG